MVIVAMPRPYNTSAISVHSLAATAVDVGTPFYLGDEMSKVWLITGSGNGLGRNVAEAALLAGDNVVATARQPLQLQDLAKKYGEKILAIKQDVTQEKDAASAVTAALDKFGRLDVLVNNAGYGRFGPFEQISAEDFKNIVDTCFYGVVYTTRAALPVMRKQRAGVIFQVSSVGGRLTRPGNSPYHAAKWAVSGFSEALAQETAAFGVQICSLEPGGIRTNWGKSASTDVPSVLPGYEQSVGKAMEQLNGYWGNEDSDPERIAKLIVRLSDHKDLPPHLLLGNNAFNRLRKVDSDRATLADKWYAISKSVDFGADTDVEKQNPPQ
jgi:NAD(P)-dependent dehydrogenase (short-subunit alcohol dehydrogenase family)